jgi:antibiotic biosynthesis monooxygenase (ABM) superfamily enzyme
MVIGGLVLLAIAMIGVVLLLTHELFGPVAAVAITLPIAVVFVTTWFVIPLARREEIE